MVLGVYVYGALVLALLFMLSLFVGDRAAALLVIAATALAYAAQIAGASDHGKVNALLALGSLMFGASAFLKIWGAF